MSGKLQGKVCVVTGAARGIGRAVVQLYGAEGARVHAIDRLADELDVVVAGIRAAGGTADAHVLDLRSAQEIATTFAAIEAREGRIDVLVNNAGVIFFKPIEAVSAEDWDWMHDINLRGTFLCCRAVAPGMKARKAGSIMNVSSNAGIRGGVDESTYCATKFGIEGLSRALALEFAPYNVAVNSVTPGHPVHTSMSEITYGEAQRKIWKDPVEIAPAFVHLALQDASGIHDQYVRAWDLAEKLRAEGWSA
ncbi:SDR family NAD(P)-dependent oxidoreductase [uncultured Alsobacter sp.]|uniref:SDR family NAD(P)-dependent oxidoreductase n=1 Tax=uncultured Alsobacter sp. TaxID=1748258 RepID=UPI0025DC655D|nr:SDR family oxidoreductase [uncultured Alsobacter sp.]